MFKLSVVFVVRFYCSNKDVEYGFNLHLSRDSTITVTTLTEATLCVNQMIFRYRKLRSVGLF